MRFKKINNVSFLRNNYSLVNIHMEQLKHECGVAMIRLLKPLEYYEEKYGTWMYGLNKPLSSHGKTAQLGGRKERDWLA